MAEIHELRPKEAWRYMQEHPGSVLVDVRSTLEYFYVGHPLGALHVPWKEPPQWTVNPDFVAEVEVHVPDRDTPVLLLCRSGQRSMDAARLLAKAGYANLINVQEGFEGPLDEQRHRNTLGGWRFHGLPWEQG